MEEDVQGLIGVNFHMTSIFQSADLAMTEEANLIEG
jgi:hypothetical protein